MGEHSRHNNSMPLPALMCALSTLTHAQLVSVSAYFMRMRIHNLVTLPHTVTHTQKTALLLVRLHRFNSLVALHFPLAVIIQKTEEKNCCATRVVSFAEAHSNARQSSDARITSSSVVFLIFFFFCSC